VGIPTEVLADIATIYHSLDNNADHPVWQSYIGLLVDWAPTARIISNAAYEGLGGWSAEFCFQWRVSCKDLARVGFSMKRLRVGPYEPDIDADGHGCTSPALYIGEPMLSPAVGNTQRGPPLCFDAPIS
jgi:hypothetical protein